MRARWVLAKDLVGRSGGGEGKKESERCKRRHPDSNRGVEVLQTSALPLGYAAHQGVVY
jgi:hypothetical protein